MACRGLLHGLCVLAAAGSAFAFGSPPLAPTLRVRGLVANPLELTPQQIQRMYPQETQSVNGLCGNTVVEFCTTWTGVSLRRLLQEAIVSSGARHVNLVGSDGYQQSISMNDALSAEGIIAFQMNGTTLPPHRGAPMRFVAPDSEMKHSVKWLHTVEVTNEMGPTTIGVGRLCGNDGSHSFDNRHAFNTCAHH